VRAGQEGMKRLISTFSMELSQEDEGRKGGRERNFESIHLPI
jgi:hypothetical protein